MPEAPIRIPETAFAAAPDYFGAVFEKGKWARYYMDEKGRSIIPDLDVIKKADRGRWALENMRVFSDGTVASPAEKWKRSAGPSIIDDWLSELRFAASRAQKGLGLEERTKLREEVKETELDIKAMMAVSASARAMEVSAGSAAEYARLITGQPKGARPDLDAQDYWQDFLLHNDAAHNEYQKLLRVINHPLIKHYYRQIIEDADIKLPEPSKSGSDQEQQTWERRRWIEFQGLKEFEYIKKDKMPFDEVKDKDKERFLKRCKLAEYLEKEGEEYKGGFDEYVSNLVLRDSEAFIEAWGAKGADDGVRWSAARLATDAFLVHMFTQWEYEIDKEVLRLQKERGEEEKGIQLKPSPGWGGNPLTAVLKPSFLPRRIKRVYRKEDETIMNMTDSAFRPEKDIFERELGKFDKGIEEFEKRIREFKGKKDFKEEKEFRDKKKELEKKKKNFEGEILQPSMTEHLKKYARYSDALWTFLGSSRGIAIPQWTRSTLEQDLPTIAELLDQVYGNVSEPKPKTGKHIVGAMMARIIQCKALATAVESARPGFRELAGEIFGEEEKERPFLGVKQFLWGLKLTGKQGFLTSLTGGRTRFVFESNDYGARNALKDTWDLLTTCDQGRGRARTAQTLAIIRFLYKSATALHEAKRHK